MTGRYDTVGNPETEFEPDSNDVVLKNKLGINGPREINDVELDLLIQLYDVIPKLVVVDQRITVADIKDWHRRWLGNVYSWAGQYRTVNISKGEFHFAAANRIPHLMNQLESSFLSCFTPCNEMSDEQLTEAIAVVHVELILIHPFREGNGRLARLLANVMAMQAGKRELDFTFWDEQKEGYFSAIQAGLDDYNPMQQMVRRVLPGV